MTPQVLDEKILLNVAGSKYEGPEYRVLISATPEDISAFGRILERAGLQVEEHSTMSDLAAAIRVGAGTAVITADTLNDIAELTEVLQHQPDWSDFPLIVTLRAGSTTIPGSLLALESLPNLNAIVLEHPIPERTLLSAVQSALRSRQAQYRIREKKHALSSAEGIVQKANEEIDSFTYTVSHDLKNPLNATQAMIDLLRSFYFEELDADGKRCIEELEKSRQRMTVMIDDLLRLSRISRHAPELQRIDLTTMVRDISRHLHLAEDLQTHVDLTIPDNLPVLADPILLQAVLENVLKNAWKFTATTENPQITVGVTEIDTQHAYFVHDNGIGFDNQQKEKIFRPFQRLHDARFARGTGIGLSIAQRAIRQMNGEIWAESPEVHGATVFFTLPTE